MINSTTSASIPATNTITWSTPVTITYPNSNPYTFPSLTNGTSYNGLLVKGDTEFEGDVTVKGKNIVDSLERIEERLAILRPNLELEEKWDKLRGLRKAYMELEQEIKEKEQIWATLKK